jgi:hypothetical protein
VLGGAMLCASRGSHNMGCSNSLCVCIVLMLAASLQWHRSLLAVAVAVAWRHGPFGHAIADCRAVGGVL